MSSHRKFLTFLLRVNVIEVQVLIKCYGVMKKRVNGFFMGSL